MAVIEQDLNDTQDFDDEDEIRRLILEAEENQVWLEESGDEIPVEKYENRRFEQKQFMKTEIISSEKQYQGHVFTVSKLNVRLPNGKIRHYDLVEHVPAVTIVPVTNDGKLIFVRQFRMGANQEILELPAGILNGENGDEQPLLAAQRECQEETGYESRAIKRIGGFYMTPGYCTEFIHVYLAQDLVWNPLPQDEDEFLKTELIPIEDAYRMAENGELNDVKTIASLLMAQKDIRRKNEK